MLLLLDSRPGHQNPVSRKPAARNTEPATRPSFTTKVTTWLTAWQEK